MSILPSQTQATSSSSSSITIPNPNLQHGISDTTSSLSPKLHHALGSLQISDYPGPSTPAAEDSGGPSEKVTELESSSGMKAPQRNSRTYSRSHSGRRTVGSPQSEGKTTGTVSSHRNQQTTGSVYSQGSTPLAGRKSQMVNGNHLLNFQYDPISRSQQRGIPPPPPARRQRKRRPYNKDLFLQANFKFMVLDSGNYSPESMDPDKMLQWEDIICVTYSTPFPVQCPICLEHPLCPQITSCGHIFCFPCILQYLMLGEEDHKGDCWKRCPLCFVMISVKDLYTLHITNVKQYQVGDNIEFSFLTRKKDSFTLSYKNKQETDNSSCSQLNVYDPFSKFTLTSDVDLSVRHAISDLDGWLARADSGLVDDLEKLPYVSDAMQQLKQRKKYWNEHKACDSEKSSNSIDYAHQIPSISANAVDTDDESCSNGSRTSSTDFPDQSKVVMLDKSTTGACQDETLDVDKVLVEQEMNLSSSYEEKNCIQGHSNGIGDAKENDSYNFYQAADGQHIILHPLNTKCLLHHYGSYDKLPHRISGRILQLETVTQSEAMRRRYRFLSHFPLTTTFQLCEVDLSEMLPPEALAPFMDEIKNRANQRKQLAKKEQKEKLKAEAASNYALSMSAHYQFISRDDPPTFSMDDFEALGNSALSSSPPVVGEKKLFSSVTRLGFAAGHDSPSFQTQETSNLHNRNSIADSSGTAGLRNGETRSYSNIISRAESNGSSNAPKTNDLGKKGKKPSRVLLSTAGGRRY
ncbi:RING/U-box superfamily protein [Trifolium repens]|nr:RING/U-box superfamily protein [Trifolium repens]